ncbi:MAG TPA: helix-turn-helix transcriptional regulator [Candidatus Baltobacteraceae bacterium]|jgi:DNA-binding NarL/FixJ family response regulator|nr:helix-turn-helix transcriptional regulator [Candidatus Baltobacteraceae bacterium]
MQLDNDSASFDALSILGGEAEQRQDLIAENELDLLRRRATPALYIVDEFLNVLHYREDPLERRRDCKMPQGGKTLPPLIERTVVALLRRTLSANGQAEVLSAAPNRSIVVRLVRLQGNGNAAFAIIADRVKIRAHMDALAQRYKLSARERQVLRLLSRGAKNSEIATQLHIAESTAIFHVKQLLAKTHSRNRTELVSKIIG